VNAIYEHAEAFATWLVELSPSMMYKLVWLEGALCLLLGAVACQIWHSAHWKSLPRQSDRRDWFTYTALRSFLACTILSLVFLIFGLLWVAWLFVEYVAWTSPGVEAAFRDAEAQLRTFSDERHFNDMSGRIVSFSVSAFGIGCSGWALFWLWKARCHLSMMCTQRVRQ